jgi:hypothetical protein
MQQMQPISPDELDDKVEINDPELQAFIIDSYKAYLRGDVTEAHVFLAKLRRELISFKKG